MSQDLALPDDDGPRLRHLIGLPRNLIDLSPASSDPWAVPGMDQVTAIERGSRTKPDGTVEQYERVEYE